MRIPTGLVPLLALMLLAGPVSAADLTMFAAASLKESLTAAASAYRQHTGRTVALSFAASSALARQIENGAPADLFVSADVAWMDYLQRRGLIDAASRRPLLANALVLIAPADAAGSLQIKPGFDLAARLGQQRLALANPDAVPAGKYAKAALQSLGVWQDVEPHLARTADVRAALMLVARAEAPYGIVYRTDALAQPKVRIVDTFAPASHAPIVYPMALTINASQPAAQDFADFLRSPRLRPLWRQYGFMPVS